MIAARIAAQIAVRAAIRRAAMEAARRLAMRLAAQRAAAARAATARAASAKRAAAAAAAKKAVARQAIARTKAAAGRVKAEASKSGSKKASASRAATKKARPSTSKPKSTPKSKPKPQQQRRPADQNNRKDGGDARDTGSCETNSFVPRTLVLLADGRRVRIDQVKVGDRVVTTGEDGKSSAQTVVATIIGKGTKDLVRVTIRTGDTNSVGDASQIVATAGHPFWVPSVGRWVPAADLVPGQWLQTSSGTWVQVEQVEAWTAQATVHNLTVNQVHTYHVLAGTAPVLVHNCGQVEYGSTDLSRAVQAERIANNDTAGNYAAARYTDESGNSQIIVRRSKGKGVKGKHAEARIFQEVSGDSITDLYSELQPCRDSCAKELAKHPNIRVSWSWNWTTSASGAGSRKAKTDTIRTMLRIARGLR